MRAITKRLVTGVLTGAPRNGFSLGDFDFLGTKGCTLVRTVTERLTSGPAASAPPVGTGFNPLYDRIALGDCWFVHDSVYKTTLRFTSVKVYGVF